jgi:flavin-dependent thymidylate synthase
MQVTLIDYTGAGHPDRFYAARLLIYTKNTRLEQSEDTRAKIAQMPEELMISELDYISKTIRSSWEMVDYTFQINDVTRAFTHQLVRTRVGVSFAQQAQRVVDMKNFQTLVPATVKANKAALEAWEDCMLEISDAYAILQEYEIPNQDCRGVLPTNVLTNIIMKVNLRALADLLGKRKNARAQGEYADVAREWERLVLEVHPWTKLFLDPERTRTPALDMILKELLGNRSPVDVPQINAALKELDMLKEVWG